VKHLMVHLHLLLRDEFGRKYVNHWGKFFKLGLSYPAGLVAWRVRVLGRDVFPSG
jgi:hypothetical protein